jgi:hypothetical protein
VAFFSLLLFLSLSGIVKRQDRVQRRVFSGLGLGMVALVGVMLFSAFQRLVLYEAAYGFSRLRVYTHVFMIWLGALLAVVVVLDILRKERTFALAALLASIGFAATLTLMNVDGLIVRQNAERAVAGAGLDVAYLASLSPDSVPVLVNALQDGSLAPGTRDAVGAALACRAYNDGSRNAATDWRSLNISNWSADQAVKLSGVRQILNRYRILDENWPVQVQTPLDGRFDCSPTGLD